MGTPLCPIPLSPTSKAADGLGQARAQEQGTVSRNDAGSMAVRPKGQGGHWSPAHLPVPRGPIPWLPCPWGGVGRVALYWSLKVGP